MSSVDIIDMLNFAKNFLNNAELLCADMQKFPLRMKDNDLLVTELYKDPSGNRITALSVYLTQKTSEFLFLLSGNLLHCYCFSGFSR